MQAFRQQALLRRHPREAPKITEPPESAEGPKADGPPPAKPGKPAYSALKILLGAAAAVVLVLLVWLGLNPPASQGPPAPRSAETEESAFVGHFGYVVRLPKGYAAARGFKDRRKTTEVVHFYKAGTDPTSLLDEGLYGQLGIVRLRAQPSPFAAGPDGLEALTRLVTDRARQRGEKFSVKPLQVSSLRGVQLAYEPPFARVEAFIVGQQILYSFLAGQDDDVYREILTSLRDSRSEI